MTFEQLRLTDLIQKFNADIEDVYRNKNLSVFHGASKKLQDVYNAELVPESGQSAYALLSTSNGNVGVVGGSDQVEELIERSKPERYVKALNAL